MNKKQFIVAWGVLFSWLSIATASMENYPPYKFKDGYFKHLETDAFVDYDTPEYRSQDGRVVIKLEKPFGLTIQDGKLVLVNVKENGDPLPYAVYWVDVDKNGFKDFIVFYEWGGSSLAGGQGEVYLNKDGKSYQKITYETIRGGLEDFVDIDKDGKYEVIITGVYAGEKHNYFTYNIYEFKGYNLVNANARFNGFPKFVWMTNKPNDKDTVHISKEQRAKSVSETDSSIKYDGSSRCLSETSESIKPLPEKEVKVFLKRLNSQGIVATFDKDMKEDKYLGWIEESSYFSLEPGGNIGYRLYRVDINNDGKDEYILCTSQGSGAFFDIDAIYQDRKGKLVDIFNEIKMPLRKLVRKAEKEKYDLEEGYAGFINGSIKIAKEKGKVFFTMEQVTRKYAGKGFEEEFNPPQSYKFLWDKTGIRLVQYYVGGKKK